MAKLLSLIVKGAGIVVRRLRTQGLKTTLLWVYARGVPKITGVPIPKYSRITRRVYVGAQYRQAGKRKLKQLDINGGVNMRLEFDDAAHGLALPHYCHLPTKDDDAPSLEHLEQGVAFIERVVAGGDSVYIHCAGGIGRAPTMAAAYLISRGASLADAISLIQQARPFISLTPPQLEQLQRFETLHPNTQTDS